MLIAGLVWLVAALLATCPSHAAQHALGSLLQLHSHEAGHDDGHAAAENELRSTGAAPAVGGHDHHADGTLPLHHHGEHGDTCCGKLVQAVQPRASSSAAELIPQALILWLIDWSDLVVLAAPQASWAGKGAPSATPALPGTLLGTIVMLS
jgi:hypothetical protein